jgi:hypothetical protein
MCFINDYQNEMAIQKPLKIINDSNPKKTNERDNLNGSHANILTVRERSPREK